MKRSVFTCVSNLLHSWSSKTMCTATGTETPWWCQQAALFYVPLSSHVSHFTETQPKLKKRLYRRLHRGLAEANRSRARREKEAHVRKIVAHSGDDAGSLRLWGYTLIDHVDLPLTNPAGSSSYQRLLIIKLIPGIVLLQVKTHLLSGLFASCSQWVCADKDCLWGKDALSGKPLSR